MTSGLEGSVSSTVGRDLRALLSFAHMVVVNEGVNRRGRRGCCKLKKFELKVDVRLARNGHVIVLLSRKGHMLSCATP